MPPKRHPRAERRPLRPSHDHEARHIPGPVTGDFAAEAELGDDAYFGRADRGPTVEDRRGLNLRFDRAYGRAIGRWSGGGSGRRNAEHGNGDAKTYNIYAHGIFHSRRG